MPRSGKGDVSEIIFPKCFGDCTKWYKPGKGKACFHVLNNLPIIGSGTGLLWVVSCSDRVLQIFLHVKNSKLSNMFTYGLMPNCFTVTSGDKLLDHD